MDIRLIRRRIGALVACTGLLAGAADAQPDEDGVSDLRVSGFGTLGVVHANAPPGWKFRRDISQPAYSGDTSAAIDSRLGVQVNYAPTTRFELVGQLVATRRSQYAANSNAVEWAFAAYRPTENTTVRLGRVNVDIYLLSDYRHVGFAYPFVRPPVDVYAVLPSSLDGGEVAQTWSLGGASWRAKAYFGRSQTGDLGAGPAIDVRPVAGLVLSRQADGLLLRASFSQTRLVAGVPALAPLLDGLAPLTALPVPEIAAQAAALRSSLDLTGALVRYAAIGADYELDDWQLSAEYTRVFGRSVSAFRAHYLAITRRFGSLSVSGIAGGVGRPGAAVQAPDWAATLAPLVGAAQAQQAQYLGAAAASTLTASASQRTLSLGARWDLHPRVALKAQWDHVRIEANGSRLWLQGTSDAGQANIFSLAVDFVY